MRTHSQIYFGLRYPLEWIQVVLSLAPLYCCSLSSEDYRPSLLLCQNNILTQSTHSSIFLLLQHTCRLAVLCLHNGPFWSDHLCCLGVLPRCAPRNGPAVPGPGLSSVGGSYLFTRESTLRFNSRSRDRNLGAVFLSPSFRLFNWEHASL